MSNSSSPGRIWSWLFSTEVALVVAIVAVLLIAAQLDSNHSYLDRKELGNILPLIARNTALLGIFALGAAVVIISGGIDLSSGSMIAFSGATAACVMTAMAPTAINEQAAVGPAAVVLSIVAALCAGLVVGTLHAWLITAIRLPPFVATLATLVGLRSLSRALVEFVSTAAIGSKKSEINVNDPFFEYLRDNVWVVVLTFAALSIVTWILLSSTVLGRHLYALGGNEQAARLSGIRTERVKWFAYCFAAFTASLAGLFSIAFESVASPVGQGRGQELNAIAAAVVGGCSLQGGIGTVPGVILGALFLQVVIDAVSKVIKTGADVYEGLIVGVVVVLAVTLSQFRHMAGAGGQMFAGPLGYCAIPVLALLAGGIIVITGGATAGIATGVVTLVLLGGVKAWEIRRSSGSSS